VARWRLREFNELPHFLWHRLNAGHDAAQRYCAQFPSHVVSHVARFVAFVAGSVAALLIALTLADERLLERDLAAGRQTVWWLALLGVVLAAARALIVERSTAAFDPGLALLEVAAHTHHLPRHWRGR
jgi:autophagy-related protein 9